MITPISQGGTGGPVCGDNLWRVGFHVSALCAISLLSGIADVLDIMWLEREEVLVLVVRSKDRTGMLFHHGRLHGCVIDQFLPARQGLMVEWARGRVFACGGN